MYFCRLVMHHVVLLTRHRGVFWQFYLRQLQFCITCHTFQTHQIKKIKKIAALNIVKNIPPHPAVSLYPPSGGQIEPLRPSSHPPPLLVVKLTPPLPTVILRHFLLSNSPLPAAVILYHSWRSNSPLPSLPVVILHSFLRSNSSLPAQRSFSTPSDCQIHPSTPSGHSPPLIAVKLTSPHPAVILNQRGEKGERVERGRGERGRRRGVEREFPTYFYLVTRQSVI